MEDKMIFKKQTVRLQPGRKFTLPCNRFIGWSIVGRNVQIWCLVYTGAAAPCDWVVVPEGGQLPDGMGWSSELCGSSSQKFVLASTCIGNAG